MIQPMPFFRSPARASSTSRPRSRARSARRSSPRSGPMWSRSSDRTRATTLEPGGRPSGTARGDVPLGQRGKAVARLSVGDERGRQVLSKLAEGADVFLQSLRPGLAERLGLSAAALGSQRPARLLLDRRIWQRGPLSREPGYDALMQAAGGLISMTGEPGRPGVRVGSSLIDMGTGMWSALGIVSALLERERTGEGPKSTRRSTRPRSPTSVTTSSGSSPTGRCRCPRERSSRWSRRTRSSPRATAS